MQGNAVFTHAQNGNRITVPLRADAGLIAMASQCERFTPKLFSLLERVGVLLTSSTRGSHRFGSPHI